MVKTVRNVLVYPRRYFAEDLLRLKDKGDVLLTAELHRTPDENQWLVRKYDDVEIKNLIDERMGVDLQRRSADHANMLLRFASMASYDSNRSSLPIDPLADGHLYLDVESGVRPKRISGYVRENLQVADLDELYLVGPEMLRIRTANSNRRPDPYEAFLDSDYARERWQMTRKALGHRIWKRLCMLRVMIVGSGRSGETAFLELARLGVGRITICDGDVLERRNLGEMKLVSDSDVGDCKVEAVLGRVNELRKTDAQGDCYDFRAINSYNFETIDAQRAAEGADVIICCVDNDGARSYASFIARRYYKVLLDIGTGVLGRENTFDRKVTGYDVRLILPPEGCIRCLGGIDEATAEIEIFNSGARNFQRRNGHLNRAGSLSSLNCSAVNEGISLLQQLAAGKVKRSVWIQSDLSGNDRSLISRFEEDCCCSESTRASKFP